METSGCLKLNNKTSPKGGFVQQSSLCRTRANQSWFNQT
ncbi:hypothetical protein SynMVIR181_01056 [Synechococcus sp. MVIR-18-1]|nr:hypothetical protein SynMVIR181_01056 [Synechococcus sp. MVIR-18-1]